MPVARAGNHHSIAVNAAVIPRRLQRHRHLRPGRKRGAAAELYSVFGNDYRVGGQGQAALPRFNRDLLL